MSIKLIVSKIGSFFKKISHEIQKIIVNVCIKDFRFIDCWMLERCSARALQTQVRV